MRINNAEALLRSAYVDWAGILINFRGIRKVMRGHQIITWTDRIPRILDNPIMASDIISLVEDGQYTFQIQDDGPNNGSIIQIYYSYDKRGHELQSARLAYYSSETDDQLINLRDESEVDLGYEAPSSGLKDGPVSWLRIEYEPIASHGVLHHDCHMHLSAFPDSRFVVAGVPNPRQFIEFIMAFCFPKLYRTHRLNEQGLYINLANITSVNSTCFPIEESIVFNQIAHFRIPVNIANRGR